MKANKQGISLIVLVITIVVVIILAAAVILALNGNNPIDNARIANYAQTKDGIASAILSYEGTIEAKTQGYFTNEEIILGSAAPDTTSDSAILKAGSAAYAIVTGSDNTPTKIATDTKKVYDATAAEVTKDLYYLDKDTASADGKFTTNVGEKLPATPASNSQWAVDANGTVYLVFTAYDKIPTWMGLDRSKVKDSPTDDDIKAALADVASDSTLAASVFYIK